MNWILGNDFDIALFLIALFLCCTISFILEQQQRYIAKVLSEEGGGEGGACEGECRGYHIS